MRFDAIVVGAGFGGLGAALALAEEGRRLLLCESLAYPGGCAGTFRRFGHAYDAGATLVGGLGPGGILERALARYGLAVALETGDPVVTLRAPGLDLPVPRDRERLREAFAAMPGAPRDPLRRFFARQREVADLLWDLLADPARLPPFGPGALRFHALRLPRYLGLLREAGRPLGRVLGPLRAFEPLRIYLEGLCRITLQCGLDEAEAPLAMAAADYWFRGVGRVRGGVGALAWALVEAIRRCGGEVLFANRVTALRRAERGWRVEARRGAYEADAVFANLLPQSLSGLCGVPMLARSARAVESGWGAAMLYLRVGGSRNPRHFQIVQDAASPFVEGNHLFVSAAEGSATVSTHLRPGRSPEEIAAVQRRMLEGVRRFAPELPVEQAMTASPRTFVRFTGRHGGFVGGIPRRAGLGPYLRLRPRAAAPGLWLVGDTIFPGQSVLAAFLGGWKSAGSALPARKKRPGSG